MAIGGNDTYTQIFNNFPLTGSTITGYVLPHVYDGNGMIPINHQAQIRGTYIPYLQTIAHETLLQTTQGAAAVKHLIALGYEYQPGTDSWGLKENKEHAPEYNLYTL